MIDQPKRPTDYSIQNIEDDLVYPFENNIKAICGHFIRIIRGNVYLVHETAREYLLRDNDVALTDIEEDDPFELEDEALVEPSVDGDSTANTLVPTITATSSWHGSFDMLSCHGIMLDVCTTFLYCVGKGSRAQQVGKASHQTQPFLAYAAMEWPAHFREVRERITAANVLYYQNLCHPRFPGFEAWMSLWQDANTMISRKGMSDNQVQDYIVMLLQLETKDFDSVRGLQRTRLLETVQGGLMSNFSSNPTAGSNHHFPVAADKNGWVSLSAQRDEVHERPSSGPPIWENPWQ
jgi:hypothetical protein